MPSLFQKNESVFNILFEAVSEGVIVVDESQNIVATNASVEQMFGYESKELIGKELNTLIPKKYLAGHGKHVEGFLHQNISRKMAVVPHLSFRRKPLTLTKVRRYCILILIKMVCPIATPTCMQSFPLILITVVRLIYLDLISAIG